MRHTKGGSSALPIAVALFWVFNGGYGGYCMVVERIRWRYELAFASIINRAIGFVYAFVRHMVLVEVAVSSVINREIGFVFILSKHYAACLSIFASCSM